MSSKKWRHDKMCTTIVRENHEYAKECAVLGLNMDNGMTLRFAACMLYTKDFNLPKNSLQIGHPRAGGNDGSRTPTRARIRPADSTSVVKPDGL